MFDKPTTKEAIRYIITSHAQGKVVVSMDFE